jgi:hypothetical protein
MQKHDQSFISSLYSRRQTFSTREISSFAQLRSLAAEKEREHEQEHEHEREHEHQEQEQEQDQEQEGRPPRATCVVPAVMLPHWSLPPTCTRTPSSRQRCTKSYPCTTRPLCFRVLDEFPSIMLHGPSIHHSYATSTQTRTKTILMRASQHTRAPLHAWHQQSNVGSPAKKATPAPRQPSMRVLRCIAVIQ